MAKWSMSDYAVAGTAITQNIMTLHKKAEMARSQNNRDLAKRHYQEAQMFYRKAEMIKKARDSYQEHELAKNKFKLEEEKFRIEHGKNDPKERRKFADNLLGKHEGKFNRRDVERLNFWANGFGKGDLDLSDLSMFSGGSRAGSSSGSGSGGVGKKITSPQHESVRRIVADATNLAYGQGEDKKRGLRQVHSLSDVASNLSGGARGTKEETADFAQAVKDTEAILHQLNNPDIQDTLMGSHLPIITEIRRQLPALEAALKPREGFFHPLGGQHIDKVDWESAGERLGKTYGSRQEFIDDMTSSINKLKVLTSQGAQREKGYWDQPHERKLTGQEATGSLQGMSLEPSAPEQAPQNDYRRVVLENLVGQTKESINEEIADSPIKDFGLPDPLKSKGSRTISHNLPPLFQHLEGESEGEIAPSGQYSKLFEPTERGGFEGTGYQGRPISIPKTESLGFLQGNHNWIVEGKIRSNITFIETAAKTLTDSEKKKPKLFEKMMTQLNQLGYPEPPDDDLTLGPAIKRMIENIIETYTKSGVQGPVGEGYTAPPTAATGNWWDRGAK